MTPIIGITAASTPATWGTWTADTTLVPASYVRAVTRAGGRALLVPPSDDAIDETLDALDAVIFSGGEDIDPSVYGAERHPETVATVPERDRGELALMLAALERDMPVLAICRGSQMLNVARGGDLVQHLPDVVGHDGHRQTRGAFGDHDIRVTADSRLGSVVGDHSVKSTHHQGFGRIGDGLRDVAWADDGTVEALEAPEKRFAVGVLWHPEEHADFALFARLVDEARACRQQVHP